jgi:hypothetical protein
MSVRGYALVIGNNAYVHTSWARLLTASREALKIAELLNQLGFIVTEGDIILDVPR